MLDDEFRLPAATAGVGPFLAGGAAGSSNDPPTAGRAGSGGAPAGTAGSAGSGGAAGVAGAPGTSSCRAPEIAGPGGRCYLWVSASALWAAARSQCQAHGAGWDLMSIRNAEDTAFIANFLTAEAWAGGDDTDGTEVWRWVDDATEFWDGGGNGSAIDDAYTHWNPNEPNGGGGHDCLRVLPSAFWADLDCGEPRTFLCEGPAD